MERTIVGRDCFIGAGAVVIESHLWAGTKIYISIDDHDNVDDDNDRDDDNDNDDNNQNSNKNHYNDSYNNYDNDDDDSYPSLIST